MIRRPPRSPLLPYATLFRSANHSPQQAPAAPTSVGNTVIRAASGIVACVSQLGQSERWNLRKDAHAVLHRKITRLNSSHANISYAVFCLQQEQSVAWRQHRE